MKNLKLARRVIRETWLREHLVRRHCPYEGGFCNLRSCLGACYLDRLRETQEAEVLEVLP